MDAGLADAPAASQAFVVAAAALFTVDPTTIAIGTATAAEAGGITVPFTITQPESWTPSVLARSLPQRQRVDKST